MRSVRVVVALVTLVLMTLSGPALASSQAEEVILRNGEVAKVSASGNVVTVTLANGETFSRTSHGNGNSSLAGPLDASISDMEKANEALDIWDMMHPPKRTRTVPVWAALLLAGIGVFNVANPRLAWYLSDGWKFRDAEPSDLALGVGRIMGLVALVLGLFLLFLG